MDVAFVDDRRFASDMRRLSLPERKRVESAMAKLAKSAVADRVSFREGLEHSHRVRLNGKLDSTLYVARVGARLRILFTLDDDPLFNRVLVTLFRLVSADEVDRTYQQVAQTLYEDFEYVIEKTNGAQS